MLQHNYSFRPYNTIKVQIDESRIEWIRLEYAIIKQCNTFEIPSDHIPYIPLHIRFAVMMCRTYDLNLLVP